MTSPNGHIRFRSQWRDGTGNSTADGSMTVSNSASFNANGHRWIRLTVTIWGERLPPWSWTPDGRQRRRRYQL